MRSLSSLLAILSVGCSWAIAQERYTLRLVVKTNRPCLLTVDGRWKTECNDVCVFTWDDYPERSKRGTITAIQTGDEQPISRSYVLVAGDQPGEICFNFQPRLFRGAHEYPPTVDHPNQPLAVPRIGHYAPVCDPKPPSVPQPTPTVPAVPAVSYCCTDWTLYFWVAAALLLLMLFVYSYWKWRICRLWNKELACQPHLASSGHASIVQHKQ